MDGSFAIWISATSTGSDVFANSAYRSQSIERWLAGQMLTSCVHRRKPVCKLMLRNVTVANVKE